MRYRLLVLALVASVLGGCATKRDLRDLRTEVEVLRDQQAQAMKQLQQQNATILDTIRVKDTRLRGDLSNQLVQIQRQLVQIQELTGQGQQTLSGLREQLRNQEAAIRSSMASGSGGPADTSAAAAVPPAGNPDDVLGTAKGAMQRGSYATARAAYQEFIRSFPQNPRAAEAQLGIGQTYEKTNEPEKALDAYQQVLQLYPNSPSAPTALYRSAMVEVGRDRTTSARSKLEQLLTAYPKSAEAPKAKDELAKLKKR